LTNRIFPAYPFILILLHEKRIERAVLDAVGGALAQVALEDIFKVWMSENGTIGARVDTYHASKTFVLVELDFIVFYDERLGRTDVDTFRTLALPADVVVVFAVEFVSPQANSRFGRIEDSLVCSGTDELTGLAAGTLLGIKPYSLHNESPLKGPDQII
jgi:hypothetical protein